VLEKKIGEECPGTHFLHMRGSPGFSGELGTTVILVRATWPYTTLCLFNKAVSRALGKPGRMNYWRQ